MTRLRIAVQKSGRLAERSLELLRAAGLRVGRGASDMLRRVENHPIDLLCVRDDDIPTFVADGVAQLGIVGANVLEEDFAHLDRRPETVMALGFGRCALRIAVPEGTDWRGPAWLDGRRIATSYPRVLGRWLAAQGVGAAIVRMKGSVEVAPRLGVAHAICDLVQTGATLEANGLKAVETVFDSEAVLVRQPGAMDSDVARLAQMMVERIEGVTASQDAKYVLLNAPRARLDEIVAILPGAGAPTVTPLAGRDDMVAVHAVASESVFWETLDRLKAAGASAILVLPIEKMMA
ncbi:MAG: ATP phosphoribosyltransferase [Sphingomonadaceae bacterium]